MARTVQPTREFTVKDIADRFILASAVGTPPIGRRTPPAEGWYIRVRTGITIRPAGTSEKFDYFYLDADGNITTAPRGHAKDYRPGRVTDIKPMAAMAEILGRVS